MPCKNGHEDTLRRPRGGARGKLGHTVCGPCFDARHRRYNREAHYRSRGLPWQPAGGPVVSRAMLREPTIDEESRFLTHVSFVAPNGCWTWLGASLGKYGCFNWGGTSVIAHRFAYRAFNGEIPAGLVVRHSCDNMRCVNPAHLSLGTQHDNVTDAVTRGRMVKKVA